MFGIEDDWKVVEGRRPFFRVFARPFWVANVLYRVS
jgi:hypothetical protein